MANANLNRKAAEFMRGRNGADELAVCAGLLALVLAVVNIFARQVWLTVVVVLLVAYAVFRIVSPDVAARRKENEAVMERLGPARLWLRNPPAALKESREYKHACCPRCNQVVRVPRGKGLVRVTCPRCGEKFELRS